MNHCENYPCQLKSGCVCQCSSCKTNQIDIKQEFEALKKLIEDTMKKANENETNCPHCGKPYVEQYPPYIPMPMPYPNPAPYQPWPWIVGPVWTGGGTITISSGSCTGVIPEYNTCPPQWINGDGGSTI